MSQSIKVVVRIRPLNSKQSSMGCHSIITPDQPNNQLTIAKPDQPQNIKSFAYDSVFGVDSLQSVVYAKTAYALVQNVLQGYNGTIFAYGQTGCGKTHSMVGKLDVEELQGIIPRSFGHILTSIGETSNKEFLIRCSFIEIYNEQVRDLLGKEVKKSLEIKQSPQKGVFIKDLSSNPAKTHQQLMQYMNLGNKNRSVGQTAMNKDSSRSHLLFMLYLQSADLSLPEQNRKYIASKLNLVDLAGSQRINKTGAQGQRLQEAKNINLSLSALGNVISALVDGKSHHIPYRDSKLTRLLQDSLGGNTKTVMVANCSPADYNYDQTLSTLRYASRAKFIKNKPIINEDPKDALLKQYASEIKKLKEILQKQGKSEGKILSVDLDDHAVSEQIRRKEQQLVKQKQQKRLLQQKLQVLQKQQFTSDSVKIDQRIKKNIYQVRKSVMAILPIANIANSDIKQIKINKNQPFSPVLSPGVQSFAAQKTITAPQSIQSRKQVIKNYKTQIKSLENELKDVQHENYMDKECILNDIRDLAKENKLLEGIVNILLSPQQLEKIKAKIEQMENMQKAIKSPTNCNEQKQTTKYGYDEDKNIYKIPNFTLKQKDLCLPKLQTIDQHAEFSMVRKPSSTSNKNQNVQRNQSIVRNNNASLLVNHAAQSEKPSNKNNSVVVNKMGKQNRKQGNHLGIKNVIQQARQANESSNFSQNVVKKVRPPALQPLKTPTIPEMPYHQDKVTKSQRPRKLEKLASIPLINGKPPLYPISDQ